MLQAVGDGRGTSALSGQVQKGPGASRGEARRRAGTALPAAEALVTRAPRRCAPPLASGPLSCPPRCVCDPPAGSARTTGPARKAWRGSRAAGSLSRLPGSGVDGGVPKAHCRVACQKRRRVSECEMAQGLRSDSALCCSQCVAAFAVSAVASQWERTGKPFNPLLGETYELIR